METVSQGGSPHFVYICSYRTYEEWKQDGENGEVGKGNVLTVPMRNGNNDILIRNLNLNIRSYRTYEEWKQG